MPSFLGNSKVESGILQNGVSLGESSTKGRGCTQMFRYQITACGQVLCFARKGGSFPSVPLGLEQLSDGFCQG